MTEQPRVRRRRREGWRSPSAVTAERLDKHLRDDRSRFTDDELEALDVLARGLRRIAEEDHR